jgi:hypothetical protein
VEFKVSNTITVKRKPRISILFSASHIVQVHSLKKSMQSVKVSHINQAMFDKRNGCQREIEGRVETRV